MRAPGLWLVLASLAVPACATVTPATRQCDAANNKAIVAAFFRQALGQREPEAAFRQYAAPGFVEHKPDVPGGTATETAAYLANLMNEMPQARWELLRSVAEGDMVVLHIRFTPAPDAPAYAITDLFRLQDCLIVEHWDVVAGPPAEQNNPNPRF